MNLASGFAKLKGTLEASGDGRSEEVRKDNGGDDGYTDGDTDDRRHESPERQESSSGQLK